MLDGFDPEFNAYMKSKDREINDPISINTSLDKVYQQIVKDPSNYNLGKYDTKQLLIGGVYENLNDYAGFESYVTSKFKNVKFHQYAMICLCLGLQKFPFCRNFSKIYTPIYFPYTLY